MIVVYGIKNCDIVKTARRWLDERGVTYRFHDLRSDGLDEAALCTWCDAAGWETLLNRKGTTWRKLPDPAKAVSERARAIELMLAHPTLIKRPVLMRGDAVVIGFSNDEYTQLFP